jgi:hypothetical protein
MALLAHDLSMFNQPCLGQRGDRAGYPGVPAYRRSPHVVRLGVRREARMPDDFTATYSREHISLPRG